MRIAKTLSITLPPDLLVKAQQTAEREHRTMSELVREALRRYIPGESRLNIEVVQGLRERFRGVATELGISSDEDLERLSSEYRASRSR